MLSIATAAPDTSFNMNSSMIFSVVFVVLVIVVVVSASQRCDLTIQQIPQIVIHYSDSSLRHWPSNSCFSRRLRFRLYRQVRKPDPLKNAISAKRFFFFIQIVETSRSIGLNYRLQEQSNTTESKKNHLALKCPKMILPFASSILG